MDITLILNKNIIKIQNNKDYSFDIKLINLKKVYDNPNKKLVHFTGIECLTFFNNLEKKVNSLLNKNKETNNFIKFDEQPYVKVYTIIDDTQYKTFKKYLNKKINIIFSIDCIQIYKNNTCQCNIIIKNIDNPTCYINNIINDMIEEDILINEVEIKKNEIIDELRKIIKNIEQEIVYLNDKKKKIINDIKIIHNVTNINSMEEIINKYKIN